MIHSFTIQLGKDLVFDMREFNERNVSLNGEIVETKAPIIEFLIYPFQDLLITEYTFFFKSKFSIEISETMEKFLAQRGDLEFKLYQSVWGKESTYFLKDHVILKLNHLKLTVYSMGRSLYKPYEYDLDIFRLPNKIRVTSPNGIQIFSSKVQYYPYYEELL